MTLFKDPNFPLEKMKIDEEILEGKGAVNTAKVYQKERRMKFSFKKVVEGLWRIKRTK